MPGSCTLALLSLATPSWLPLAVTSKGRDSRQMENLCQLSELLCRAALSPALMGTQQAGEP